MLDENTVAAFVNVMLHNAESSHVAGYKLTLRLADDADIKQFAGITKRKAGKAGGRYHGYLLDSVDGQHSHELDLIFLGWTVSNTAGAKIRFELADEADFNHFREAPVGRAFSLTLVELDDEENPVDQSQREAAETLKGGPRAQRVGAMCANIQFQAYVSHETRLATRATPDQAADYIRKLCEIQSRAELDHDPVAWERFSKRVSLPFAVWCEL